MSAFAVQRFEPLYNTTGKIGGIPLREDQNLDYYLRTLSVLLPGTAGVRRAGAASLDLAYVAAGRLDGFWEIGLHEWSGTWRPAY
ncbi:Inositol monophosphatase family protein [Ectothiorhodospira magna]|uniref:Inositol monophosphatase family protein n=1 Tax=Ectothiorhodospira magna TaxID=867345 RepID=A0A1H8ZS01_9GAMM|nr:Inositol monophosphatase family protein [Ectothiorhodospira magna]